MGQRQTKQAAGSQNAGLIPASASARSSCELKRVRRLIQKKALAPCYTGLADGEGHECPVCMENFAMLNRTDCCNQAICTECFINIVADGCTARCPYCQAGSMQVYLPRPGSAPASRAPTPAASLQAKRPSAAMRLAAVSAFNKAPEGVDTILLLPGGLDGLAQAAARASRAAGPPVVGMVLTREPPAPRPPSPRAAAAPAGPAPALLLHPDGTGQLVLLSSGQAPASPTRAQQAAQQQQQQQQQQATYEAASGTADDARMRAAIARADAALRGQQPAAGADWLARMRAADAAVCDAVARTDARRAGNPPSQP